jgi:hypothetical protein
VPLDAGAISKEAAVNYFRVTLVAVLMLCAASALQAGAVYTYTGNTYTEFFGASCPPLCNISGSFTLAAPLAANLPVAPITPLSFSFTDGLATIDSSNSATGPFGSTNFFVGTDAVGEITVWNNGYFSATNFMFSGTNPPGCTGCSVTDQSGTISVAGYFGRVNDNPGTWTLTVTDTVTPEPSGRALLGLGAVMFAMR